MCESKSHLVCLSQRFCWLLVDMVSDIRKFEMTDRFINSNTSVFFRVRKKKI